MATPVKFPSVGESVTEGVLVRWHKQDGERVELDQPICELETDKANVDLPSPGAGFLRTQKKVGDVVKIGEILASLEDSAPAGGAASAAPAAPVAKAAPAPRPAAGASRPSVPDELAPSVRKLVVEKALDPTAIPATGKAGRLTKEDVIVHLEGGEKTAAPVPPAPSAPPKAPAPAAVGGVRKVAITKFRKKIAERLVAAQSESAMLTTFNEVDMSAVIGLRKLYKERFEKTHGVGLGFMSFFVRAAQLALQEVPEVNAFFGEEELEYHDYYNIGIAVSTERGLIVPVLKRVESKSMAQIEKEIKRVAGSAREGKLGLDEMSGGTFTITNGGIFGSLMSTPILNKPQTGILGMHAIKDRPVAIDGKVEIRPMMYLALSYDHRMIDGAQSVTFLVKVKERIEDPSRLLLEI